MSERGKKDAIGMTNAVKAGQSCKQPQVEITLDGTPIVASEGDLLIQAILRHKELPHICYHSPLMGPIQTCDTCIVEVDGQLVRSCGTKVGAHMKVVTESKRAKDARSEAFDVMQPDGG
jgi:formate dehydrogenase major subunit